MMENPGPEKDPERNVGLCVRQHIGTSMCDHSYFGMGRGYFPASFEAHETDYLGQGNGSLLQRAMPWMFMLDLCLDLPLGIDPRLGPMKKA